MFGKDFSFVCGNKKLIGYIKSEVRRGSVGHAYIIEGPKGVGKRDFADAMAAALLCEGKSEALPCGGCVACKHIAAGSHPDIRVIDKGDEASLKIRTIREVRKDAHTIPSESDRKIYIIDDADRMTEEAQNAFLLALEEPPAYVTYLLLCDDSSSLLETIRSRAPSLRLAPASRSELEEYLLNRNRAAQRLKDTDPEGWTELITSSAGCAETAMSLLTGNALAARIKEKREALDLLTSLLSTDGDAYVTVGTLKKPKRDSIKQELYDIALALRDMLVSKKSASAETVFFTDISAAASASAPYSSKKLALTLDLVNATLNKISSNAQVNAAVLSMAVMIKSIK